MTADELRGARAKLNELTTQGTDLRRGIDEGIEAARQINARVRAAQAQVRATDAQAEALRAAIRAHEEDEAARAKIPAEGEK